MIYNFIFDDDFTKDFKRLSKKYPSLKTDFEYLVTNIEHELKTADDLGNGFKKIRISIKSKGKGKSGGGRIITYETIVNTYEQIVLFAVIYDKSEYSKIDLEVLKKNINL